MSCKTFRQTIVCVDDTFKLWLWSEKLPQVNETFIRGRGSAYLRNVLKDKEFVVRSVYAPKYHLNSNNKTTDRCEFPEVFFH